jgi:hypothetical protein
MTANRQKSAWIWLAVAAVAVVTLTRAESGLPRATTFTNPVLQFLSAHADSESLASFGLPGNQDRAAGASHGKRSGVFAVMLPILFIGLVAPLSLVLPNATMSLGRKSPAPDLSCHFQRPPPCFAV